MSLTEQNWRGTRCDPLVSLKSTNHLPARHRPLQPCGEGQNEGVSPARYLDPRQTLESARFRWHRWNCWHAIKIGGPEAFGTLAELIGGK
jgi:hypothetical protein